MHDRQSQIMRANHFFLLAFCVGAIGLAVYGSVSGDAFYLRLATEALIFAGLALSVDLLLGCTGALSLGQALYFGIGAYASALIMLETSSFWLAMVGAGGASIVAAFLGGLIANRVRGVYFTLITLGLAQVVGKIIYNTRELGASDGIIGIPIVNVGFGQWSVSAASPIGFFFIVLAIIAILYGFLAYLLETPFGRVLIAIKTNERRVPFLGYSAWRARMIAYVLAGLVAGLSGALYPMLRGFVSPELLSFSASGNAVVSVLIGGVGTLVGALYGSVILVVIKSVLGSWTEHHLIVVGALFMASILFLPRGLIGLAHSRLPAQMPESQETASRSISLSQEAS
ncbi:branched-chain amino acid transport system permease protein [Nitrobacteraceae bacterium AZCC 1564]